MLDHKKNRKPKCPNAGIEGTYIEKYDAYACELCCEWLEPKCNSDICTFCKDRPERPFED